MESQSLVRIVKNRNRRLSFFLVLACGVLYFLIQTILFRVESQTTTENLRFWLDSHKARLSKALYFNNQADLKTLLNDLREKNSQNERILSLKIFNKKGTELQSNLAKTLIPLPSTFPGNYWNGLVSEDLELRFAGTKVGSVFVRSHYRSTKLVKQSIYALIICILLGFFLSVIGNRLMKTVGDAVLKPLHSLNSQLSTPLNSVQSLHTLSLSNDGAQKIPTEISQLVNEYNLQVEQIKDLNSTEIKTKENQAMERLADQVAHDIRSPLTALNLVVGELTIPDCYANVLKGSIARINEIADSLLNSRKNTVIQPIIAPLLNQITNELRARYAKESKLSIELTPSLETLHTKIPSDLLSRMLSNVMNNALEAMPQGGKLSVGCEEEEGIPVITVCDTGQGIPPESLSELGKHGYSFGKATGNGLGLWSAKECMKEFDGEIEISSVLGQGTEVRLYV